MMQEEDPGGSPNKSLTRRQRQRAKKLAAKETAEGLSQFYSWKLINEQVQFLWLSGDILTALLDLWHQTSNFRTM